MKRLTARRLMSQDDCLRIGDVVYFPWIANGRGKLHWLALAGYFDVWNSRVLNRNLANNDWFFAELERRDEIHVDDRTTYAKQHPHSASFFVHIWYSNDKRSANGEPKWFANLDRSTRRWLRATWRAYSDVYGRGFFSLYSPLSSFAPPPYAIYWSGINYGFENDGIIAEAFTAFGLNRTAEICQLGCLRDPLPEKTGERGPGSRFDGDDHARYPHLADVPVLLTLLLRNNRKTVDPVLARHIIAAGASHDAATVAGGDTTKLVDRKLFDEEKEYERVLQTSQFRKYAAKYELSADLLTQIVQGKHPVGSTLLDVADKISYTARDTSIFLMRSRILGPRRGARGRTTPGFGEIVRLIERHPLICTLWETVRVKEGQVYFRSGRRLYWFLRLRALMFREVYFNPAARGEDHTIITALTRFMLKYGMLTADELFKLNDNQLRERIEKATGARVANLRDRELIDRPTYRELFESEQTVASRAAELAKAGCIVVVEDLRKATGDGSKLLVQTRTGIKSFAQAMPQQTLKLRAIFAARRHINLYGVAISSIQGLRPEIARRLERSERQRTTQATKEKSTGTQ